jgi:hypothetical protein
MKRGWLVLWLALAPAFGQMKMAANAPVIPVIKAPPPGSGLGALEKNFDDNLQITGMPDRVQLRGFTRGLRLDDYGAIFTAEVDLVAAPTLNPFQTSIAPQQVGEVHRRKLVNLPLLRKTMRDMMMVSANTLTGLAPEGHIVVAVRLAYQSWEQREGLPAQIVMRATRQDALAGQIQTTEDQ